MKRRAISFVLCAFVTLAPVFAADSLAATTQESTDDTTDQTTRQSSDQTTEGSAESTAEIGAASAVVLTVVGAAVAVGITVVGVIYVIRVSEVRMQNVIALQDQIYSGYGPDYDFVINELGVTGEQLARANDELVVAGYAIDTHQDAADFLLALLQRLDIAVEVQTANAN